MDSRQQPVYMRNASLNDLDRRNEVSFDCVQQQRYLPNLAIGSYEGPQKGWMQHLEAGWNTHQREPYSMLGQCSNLVSFVFSVSPVVSRNQSQKDRETSRILPDSPSSDKGLSEEESSFQLSDLWESFEEWSAYGCGVNMSLGHGEAVVQYYVPHLSAIQLFVRSSIRKSNSIKSKKSEYGDADVELKDWASETSEGDGFHLAGSDTSSSEPCSAASSVFEDSDGVMAAWLDCKEKQLLFQYFEEDPPYVRPPLHTKIQQLEAVCAELTSLNSNDLHPASWMSVAWYPVYRISAGPSFGDLSACFLTYHALSTKKPPSHEQCPACATAHWTSQEIHNGSEMVASSLKLCPFGLAGHKLAGATWAGNGGDQLIHHLLCQPERWLAAQNVHHPDYEYFKAHPML